jgi:hypothetical protein
MAVVAGPFGRGLASTGCGDKQFHDISVGTRGCVHCHQALLKVVVSAYGRSLMLDLFCGVDKQRCADVSTMLLCRRRVGFTFPTPFDGFPVSR